MKRAFVAAALAALLMQLIFGAIAAGQAKNANGSRYIVQGPSRELDAGSGRRDRRRQSG